MDNTTKQSGPITVGLLCGGPSFERGISLNSARSVLDHLQAPDITIVPIYFDTNKRAWEVSTSQLYSNTPSDFDFKLARDATPLDDEALTARLRSVDIVFPAIHGQFGEDGELQAYLESIGVPFVGSSSAACARAYDKFDATQFRNVYGYHTIPTLLLQEGDATNGAHITDFFAEHDLTRAIVKPARAGSSIGVFSVGTVKEAIAAVTQIYTQGIDDRVVIEPFVEGVEFTMIIIDGPGTDPVALIPTEVEIEYDKHQIFDYRKKYLPTGQVTWHSPPRFDDEMTRQIQHKGEQLFRHLALRDVARFDGWLTTDGQILFSDINPVSGMEQNSFLFLQCAQLGMSHTDTLRYVLSLAAARAGLSFLLTPPAHDQGAKTPVAVLFGGDTAERQVSLMSGTNVWFKLRRSTQYQPIPYLLDTDLTVWQVPYAHALHHTVEEVVDACQRSAQIEARVAPFREVIVRRLGLADPIRSEREFVAHKMTLEAFIAQSQLVFIGLHGGMGEDGQLQQRFDQARIGYTGSRPQASALMMDKYATSDAIRTLHESGITVAPKLRYTVEELKMLGASELETLWTSATAELRAHSLIVKPIGDGCSAGVVRLYSTKDLATYLGCIIEGTERLAPGTIHRQTTIVEMPSVQPEALLLEPFIETDQVLIVEGEIFWKSKTDWIEVTVGVLGRQDNLKALTPSLTVASGEVLTVEEKFQGGTGVNITPPPPEFVARGIVTKVQQSIEKVAKALGVNGYARIDCFVHRHTGDILVIEANSLPALTPSTVLYHQALAESPPLFPTQLLEKILEYRVTPKA